MPGIIKKNKYWIILTIYVSVLLPHLLLADDFISNTSEIIRKNMSTKLKANVEIIGKLKGKPAESISSEDRNEIMALIPEISEINFIIKFDKFPYRMSSQTEYDLELLAKALNQNDLQGKIFLIVAQVGATYAVSTSQLLSDQCAEAVKRHLSSKNETLSSNIIAFGHMLNENVVNHDQSGLTCNIKVVNMGFVGTVKP